MTAIIIVLSVIFAAISIGTQILISNKFSPTFIDDDNNLNSSKVKTGAIILLILNAYSFIRFTISLFSTYSEDWIAYDMEKELGLAFSHIFSLLIIISYIAFAIFLLKKNKRLALLSSASIIILSVFDAIFIQTTTIMIGYISFLPSLLVLFSFIILFTPFHIGHQKVVKATPFLFLLGIINNIVYVINLGVFDINIALSLAITVLKIVAFLLMFNAVAPSLKNAENENKAPLSNKKTILIVLSIFIFPLVVSLLSSIGKVWLFVSLVLLAISVPGVIVATKNSTVKTKSIALICTFSVVIGICVGAKLFPSNYTDPDGTDGWTQCYKCDKTGKVRNKLGYYVTCPRCDGVGYLPD